PSRRWGGRSARLSGATAAPAPAESPGGDGRGGSRDQPPSPPSSCVALCSGASARTHRQSFRSLGTGFPPARSSSTGTYTSTMTTPEPWQCGQSLSAVRGSLLISPRQIRSEVGAREVGLRKVGVPEDGPRKIGAREVGAPEVGAPEVGAPEVGVREVGALRYRLCHCLAQTVGSLAPVE